jgi:hypothetical protein
MSYKETHTSFKMPEGVVIPEGFIDNSWEGDTLPKWWHPKLKLSLWINYPDSDVQGADKFILDITNEDADLIAILYEGNNWQKVLDLIIGVRKYWVYSQWLSEPSCPMQEFNIAYKYIKEFQIQHPEMKEWQL